MRTHRIYALRDCAKLARMIPPRPAVAITGTAVLLASLVAAAVVWAALTEADLVVRAPARVRARSAPQLSFTASSGEQVAAATAGRVDRVVVVQGQTRRGLRRRVRWVYHGCRSVLRDGIGMPRR